MRPDDPTATAALCTCGGEASKRWPGQHAASCPQYDPARDDRLRADLAAIKEAAAMTTRTPEGFTPMTLPVKAAGHHMAGYVTALCCDDCGSLVGNTVAHRLLCFREERDGG